MKKICIVMPMYGKPELTDKCIQMCGENAGIEHDILVVDDCSLVPYLKENLTEKKDLIKKWTTGLSVLKLEENLGFTGATNAGILWCGDRYDYIHFMNNDTEPRENFLKILFDVLEDEANEVVAIAGSARVVMHEEKEVYELVSVDLVSGYHTFVDEEGYKKLPPLIHTHWFPLCSALIRHTLIREIGLLDKRMRMWCSDNDYCIRANFAGYNTTVVPASVVRHAQQGTTGKAPSKGIKDDQDVLMSKIMNVQYAVLMDKMPLDSGNGVQTWGRPNFEVYKKGSK